MIDRSHTMYGFDLSTRWIHTFPCGIVRPGNGRFRVIPRFFSEAVFRLDIFEIFPISSDRFLSESIGNL